MMQTNGEPHVKGYGRVEPYRWKAIAAIAATALAQIAIELRRMADAKERRDA